MAFCHCGRVTYSLYPFYTLVAVALTYEARGVFGCGFFTFLGVFFTFLGGYHFMHKILLCWAMFYID